MRRVAQAAACPADASRKSSTSASFYRYFRIPGAPAYCSDARLCMADAACYGGLLGHQMRGFLNESEAVKAATEHPGSADAVLVFQQLDLENVSYAIRMNHTRFDSQPAHP